MPGRELDSSFGGMEAVEVGERKSRARVLNKTCSDWTASNKQLKLTKRTKHCKHCKLSRDPRRLKLSSFFFFFCHFQTSSLSPHVVSPSSLSPLSLSLSTLLSLVLYLPLFSFSFFVSFCAWVYRIWRCELGGILDKVFHILLATMSKFDSPQIDSVIDDDDEFW